MPDDISPMNLSSVPETGIVEFLTNVPPHQPRWVFDAWSGGMGVGNFLMLQEIELYCESDPCRGKRFFDPKDAPYIDPRARSADVFVDYVCRNCKDTNRTFALRIIKDSEPPRALMVKIGEFPRVGDPLPPKLRKYAGSHVGLLDKGFRAERDGLGIAAFVYYRRVVEAMKVQLIDEILKASRVLSASPELIAELETAKTETRFTQAVGAVKHGIPQALLINGHNPLTMLHDALSDHLHGKSDEECLELATIVRLVLAELSEKLSAVFADKKEVEGAVNKLLQMKAQRTK